jgi:hypothetical protein
VAGAIAQAALNEAERGTLKRFGRLLAEGAGLDVDAVQLYGSHAAGRSRTRSPILT